MTSRANPAAEVFDQRDNVQWSDDFGCRFLVSVDTEEEFDWNGPFERDGHTNVSVSKLERFQAFVEKYEIDPVYFVDYSIIEHPEAAAFLKLVATEKRASIGVHLHPWINPPFEEETNNYNSYAGNLPKELEEQKILALREAISEKIGETPIIYRAGRYGVGPNSIDILAKHGFLIDSSVRSRFDYRAQSGPDFAHIGPKPFWLDAEKSLFELPLTTVFSGPFRQQADFLSPLFNRSKMAETLLSKSKMFERIPLTPEGVTAREAKEAIDVALDDQLQLLVFSFHSPSLSAGHTPYVQSSADLDKFYDWWRLVIDHLIDRGVSPISITQLLAASGLDPEKS
ncbi:MAG: polysaccharide deacetylase family protein [Parasphingorhabdus sp.]|uniref:polysaccharide deacetylase family protein n=1 Tax=Parasphingorhabdus sp. TaxID=2709688 RepID=UPI00329875D7